MPAMLRKGGRCTRGGGTSSCGQILNKGDEEKPLLKEGNFLAFKKHKKLAQWEPKLNTSALIFV
jgi:hypothetical protein